MIVSNQIDAADIDEYMVQGKFQNGAKKLVVNNGSGYRNVVLEFQEFNDGWHIKGVIELSGNDLQKAITNAMNT